MKNIVKALLAIFAISLLSTALHAAADYEYELSDRLSGLDISGASEFLYENGVDPSEPESVSNITAESILKYFWSIFQSSLSGPARLILTAITVSMISQIACSLSFNSRFGKEVFVIICFVAISGQILTSVSDMLSSLNVQQAFIASYIPIFAVITAASGNIAGAATYNALVLYAAEGVTLISTLVLRPMLCCMLVIACAQSINPTLPDITGTIKRLFTGVIGVLMTVFVGVIGLQTVIGRTGTGLALRAGRYLVSSFVPIIGMSLSESYKNVMLSISAIRSAVGALGIVVILVVLSVPIVTMLAYKVSLRVSEIVCGLTGSDMLASLMRGLADVYSLCVTLLLTYLLMFVISTGVMILIGSEAYL